MVSLPVIRIARPQTEGGCETSMVNPIIPILFRTDCDELCKRFDDEMFAEVKSIVADYAISHPGILNYHLYRD